MLPLLYSEVNIFCIMILFLILRKIQIGRDLQNNQRLFIRVLLSNIFFFLLDLAWIHIDGGFLQISVFANHLINGLYYVLSGLVSYFWFVYSETMLGSRTTRTRASRLLAAVPLLILIILSISSVKTGWLFYIDQNNYYHRGPFYAVQLLFSYGYILFAATHALITALRSKSYITRAKYLPLAFYVLFPLFFGTLQVLFPAIPLLCVGTTFATLYVYTDFQSQLISLDPLTQLNNRRQLMKFLPGKIAHSSESRLLFLLLMDIDLFKSINDRFGHVEGDLALIRVANVLRKVCSGQNCFICRYGGDEFIVVCETPDELSVDFLCQDIHHAILQENAQAGTAYSLALSIGCQRYEKSFQTEEDWIHAADEKLYAIKREKKHD
ncbi:MAG: GGDEF domain-containing protein [Oscillospiraceae bacterium]|nr:GGDEF domain-containing protein [Oscillospiraceae bacterium]